MIPATMPTNLPAPLVDRPQPGTIPLPELVDRHTGRTGELPAGRTGWHAATHKWRPDEPMAWRPTGAPPLRSLEAEGE